MNSRRRHSYTVERGDPTAPAELDEAALLVTVPHLRASQRLRRPSAHLEEDDSHQANKKTQ
jgi:hypothetical protein